MLPMENGFAFAFKLLCGANALAFGFKVLVGVVGAFGTGSCDVAELFEVTTALAMGTGSAPPDRA